MNKAGDNRSMTMQYSMCGQWVQEYHPFDTGKVAMSNQIPCNGKVTMSDRRKTSVFHKPCSCFILDRLCKCPDFYECNSPNCFPHRREEVMNY